MTVPTIRIDDDVYDWLKLRAEPFVDTPNTVLRRELGLDTPPESSTADVHHDVQADRMRPGDLLDRKIYDLRILEVIDRMGGSGYAPEVIDEVGKLVGDQLTPKDWLRNKSGVIRWQNRVAWRRFSLVKMGLLKSGSPRGTWEISDQGRQALADGRIDYEES